MADKHKTDALVVGGSFVGFVGWLGSPILKCLGYVDLALDLHQGMAVTKGINFVPLYMWLFVSCIAFLVIHNWAMFAAWKKQRQRNRIRQWNTTVPNAINWIATVSYQGKSFDYGNRYMLAAKSLMEKARSGELKLAGVKGGIYNQIPIPKRDMRSLDLYCTYTGVSHSTLSQASRNKGEAKDAALVLKTSGGEIKDKSQLKWASLMVDRKELQKVWPSNVSR